MNKDIFSTTFSLTYGLVTLGGLLYSPLVILDNIILKNGEFKTSSFYGLLYFIAAILLLFKKYRWKNIHINWLIIPLLLPIFGYLFQATILSFNSNQQILSIIFNILTILFIGNVVIGLIIELVTKHEFRDHL